MKELNQSNIFFHNLGNLKLEVGELKLIKTIDLKELFLQIDIAEKEARNISHVCQDNFCKVLHLSDKAEMFNVAIDKLRHDLEVVCSLMVHSRKSRSINFIGSGLKYLFGVMDNDDEVSLKSILGNLTEREDSLHSSMMDTVQVVKNINKQNLLLRENQKVQFDNLVSLKTLLYDAINFSKSIEWEMKYQQLQLQLSNFILSIQMQVDKVHNAILFLKAGVVDPYFFDSTDLYSSLTYKKVNYFISEKDVETILTNSKLIAVSDSKEKLIHIVMEIPIVSPEVYTMYENFVIPKVVDSNIIALSEIPRYFVPSMDNTKFFINETLDCFKITNLFICKNTITFSMALHRTCVVDMFYDGTDSNCSYKKFLQHFYVHNLINDGLIVFSPKVISIRLTCPKHNESVNIVGSHHIEVPINCSVNSILFNYTNYEYNHYIRLSNKVPRVICCSKFYKEEIVQVVENTTLAFKSLHNLQDVKFENVEKELNFWKKFDIKDFGNHVYEYKWSLSITGMVFICAIGLYFILKMKKCSFNQRPSDNVTVIFRNDSLPTSNDFGYKFND